MIAVHETCFAFWDIFWETLEEAECLWAKQMFPDARTSFEQTIESMLMTSIPSELMPRICDAWSSLHLERPLSEYRDDALDQWWNLVCMIKGPDQLTDEEAKDVATELWRSQAVEAKAKTPVSQDALDAAPGLLRWLKYGALCTVWQFSNAWSCYTSSMPREVSLKLCEGLFSLAMLVLLRQLR